MNMYEIILVVLNIAALAFILISVGSWPVAVALMAIMIIVLVQKMWFRQELAKMDQKKDDLVEVVSAKIQDFSDKIVNIRDDVNRHMFAIENKISGEGKDYEKEMEMYYRDLAKKILDVENNLSKIKRTLGAGLGAMEERIGRIETELGMFTTIDEATKTPDESDDESEAF